MAIPAEKYKQVNWTSMTSSSVHYLQYQGVAKNYVFYQSFESCSESLTYINLPGHRQLLEENLFHTLHIAGSPAVDDFDLGWEDYPNLTDHVTTVPLLSHARPRGPGPSLTSLKCRTSDCSDNPIYSRDIQSTGHGADRGTDVSPRASVLGDRWSTSTMDNSGICTGGPVRGTWPSSSST